MITEPTRTSGGRIGIVVQTFLPDPDFAVSAAALDDRRLGRQRSEALQILRALLRPGYGWQHHPAVRMWRGYPEAVASYALAICDEWSRRGKADTVADSVRADVAAADLPIPRSQADLAAEGLLPDWLGDDRVHASHRAALVAKLPEHYAHRYPGTESGGAYYWPV